MLPCTCHVHNKLLDLRGPDRPWSAHASRFMTTAECLKHTCFYDVCGGKQSNLINQMQLPDNKISNVRKQNMTYMQPISGPPDEKRGLANACGMPGFFLNYDRITTGFAHMKAAAKSFLFEALFWHHLDFDP